MISNSAPQKQHIEERAAKLKLLNICVKTRNVATMQIDDEDCGAFDRIVSVEMLEHMKNYELLLEKVSKFLKDDGLFFVHIFTHARASYHFETEGADNWMGRLFFTGGAARIDRCLCAACSSLFCRHHAEPHAAQEPPEAPCTRSVMGCQRPPLRAHKQRVVEEDGRQHRHNSPHL
jgi:cyclopropane fatty-acyl-phospholipid synthase-like methyltransferase